METQTQIQLIQAVQSGDTASFGALYDEYVREIYRFIYYKTHQKEVAEDLTSHVFMKALEKIHSFKGEKGVFRGWLYQIARNTVIDHYRTQKKTGSIEDAWDISSDDDVELTVSRQFDKEELRKYLSQLKSEQRDIILMRLWQDMSYEEIALALGKSETNCRVTFSRGIVQLRKIMPAALFILFLLGSPLR